jgi:hypothetical protein
LRLAAHLPFFVARSCWRRTNAARTAARRWTVASTAYGEVRSSSRAEVETATGTYTVSGTTLSYDDGSSSEFCVQDGTLTESGTDSILGHAVITYRLTDD